MLKAVQSKLALEVKKIEKLFEATLEGMRYYLRLLQLVLVAMLMIVYFFSLPLLKSVDVMAWTAIIPPLNFLLALNSFNLAKYLSSILSRFAILPYKKVKNVYAMNSTKISLH